MASDILKGLYQKNRKENILLYSIFAEMKCINYAWREGHYENRDRLIELIKQLDTLNDNKQYKSNGNLVAMLYLETEYNLGVYEKEYLENAIERYQYFSDEVKNEEVINYLYALCLELNGNIETAENIYAGLDWRSDANIACRYLICKLSRNDYAEAVKVYKEYNSSEINTKLKSLYLTAVYYDDTDNYLDSLVFLYGGFCKLESEFQCDGYITISIFYHSSHVFFAEGFSFNTMIREPLFHLNYGVWIIEVSDILHGYHKL